MDIKHEQDKIVVVLKGDWTIANAAQIENEIQRALEEGGQPYEIVGDKIES
jgi:anti-anti-sigma regulatory factor